MHLLRYGVKVRRDSWGLRTCWGSVKGSAEQGYSDLVQSDSAKSLLDQSSSWAMSQSKNWLVRFKKEFRRELKYLLCAKWDGTWGETREWSYSQLSFPDVCLFWAGGNMSKFRRGFLNLSLTLPKHWHCVTQFASSVTIPAYVYTFNITFIYKNQSSKKGFCCLLFCFAWGIFS